MVTAMVAYGIPQDDIATCVIDPFTGHHISDVTLRKHFAAEIRTGTVRATAAVAGALYKNATTGTKAFPGGVPLAQIFWLKTRARWRTADKFGGDPPPPPPAEVDLLESVRQIAFALELGAQAAEESRAIPGESTRER